MKPDISLATKSGHFNLLRTFEPERIRHSLRAVLLQFNLDNLPFDRALIG